jgi:putative spermidine/putrescine transport system ATP-binding protein
MFVADFLGESNLLDAKVTARDGDQVRVAMHGEDKGSAMVYDPRVQSGHDIKLMLRPQNLRVHGAQEANGADGAGHATMSATLTDIMVTGGMTKLYMRARRKARAWRISSHRFRITASARNTNSARR